MKYKIGKTFLLGLGFFGVSVIWSVYNAYVPVFLESRFALSTGFIGVFMTLDNIAALFIQPAVGAWSDRLRTPIGRRMPFILIGAPIAAVAFYILPKSMSLPVFFFAASLLLLAMAVWRTPVVALMPDITPSKYRSQANGIINFMGGVGAIIAFLFGATLYEMNPSYPFWLGSILVLVAAILVFIFIKEPKEYDHTPEETPNLWQSIKLIFQEKDRNTLRILLAIFFWFIAYNGIEAFFTLYGKNYLGISESDAARLLGQLSTFFVLFSLPSGYIGAAVGRKKTIIAGIILMALCVASLYFLPTELLTTLLTTLPLLGKVPVIGVILMIMGIGWALININSLPMVVDMTESSRIGTYTGLYYLFSTLAAILGPTLYGFIIQFSAGKYNLLMLISPIFLLGALISIAGVKRGEIQQES
ncbi:MAG TPA: MFS transporter [Anaerolineaceae bacterium]|uniref:Major facilitator superfamily transporter n=1 Tax=Anaerolinea thermophila TaxID=167964 RepID=A0A101FYD2_9CHLR|nr:MAG: Major facilitator superfamily transporter [Anaerolinea thermophila]HAF62475.1 MFS transporter [Anaerolineaceae bacterium]